MKQQRTLRFTSVAVLVLVAFLFQETWALAGVTGNVTGIVRDSNGVPLAGVSVKAVSPSQTATATTDPTGHFVLLSLAPDTYTLSLNKNGYQGISVGGTVVFADQTQTVSYALTKTLKTIASVTSQAGSSLVKSGIGGDLYSVNASQAAAAAALGGGGNLNSAYSAMASVPGIQTSQGGMGWDFNAAYVRGQNSYYTGFEYDGIPINRSFDNYNSGTESSLGLSELQVYTGGGLPRSPPPARPVLSTRSSRPVPSRASRRPTWGSRRRSSIIRRASRSAARLPTETSATTWAF